MGKIWENALEMGIPGLYQVKNFRGKSWEIPRKWRFIPGKTFKFCWGIVQACD